MTSARKRILITGGAGFIGYHLARELAREASNDIVLVDNCVRGRRDQELSELLDEPNVQMIEADLTDAAAYRQLGDGYDEVYHLAAIIGVKHVMSRPHTVVRVNALSTLLLLDWFVQCGTGKVVFASTSEAYAWTRSFHGVPIPTPEDVPLALTDLKNPRSSYAGSKIFGELAVTQYCQQYQRPFAIVRYHNVYGPRMGYDHVIPELFSRIMSGEDPLVVYSADHSRAFCYVKDAVRATMAAMRSQQADGQTLHVGNDQEEIKIGELARRVLRAAGRQGAIRAEVNEHDPISRRCPDISLARQLLRYEPAVTLERGLAETIAWYGSRLRQAA